MNSTLNITLPPQLKKWVERQVANKRFGTADELVLDALRKEQAREAREQIDALLIDAINSGESTPMTAKDWQNIRAEGRRRFRARQKK